MEDLKSDSVHLEEGGHEKHARLHARDINQGNEAVLLRVGTADIQGDDSDLKVAKDGHVFISVSTLGADNLLTMFRRF